MQITKAMIEETIEIASHVPAACYTGQSSLTLVPDPTFTVEEMNQWEAEPDVDFFCYNQAAQATMIQKFIDSGYLPANSVEQFKANRIRFCEPNRRFSIQTVKLQKEGMPIVNISWRKNESDALDVIKGYDMDYVCVSMDLANGVWCDLRGKDHRVAHVNKYNARFDPDDSEPSYWYRQFDRVTKGWSRGIDTRAVAETYLTWINRSLEIGDRTLDSATRKYADQEMERSIVGMLEAGVEYDVACSIYHAIKGEEHTWPALKAKHEQAKAKVEAWLEAVNQ